MSEDAKTNFAEGGGKMNPAVIVVGLTLSLNPNTVSS